MAVFPPLDASTCASTVVGICGSDMHAALGKHPFIDLPYQPGHEVVGVIEEVGPGADGGIRQGDRVVVEGVAEGGARQEIDFPRNANAGRVSAHVDPHMELRRTGPFITVGR